MADIYTSTSGSNTSPYDTWAKAATNPQNAVNLSADGDTVWWDDENFERPSGIDFTQLVAGTHIMRSRSDDSSLCNIWRASATARLLGLDGMVNAVNLTFRGIGVYNTAEFTSAGGGCFGQITGADANITFQSCGFKDTVVNGFINNIAIGAYFRTSAAAVSRTITFTDCTFNGLNVTATACASFINLATNNKLVVTNPTIPDFTVTVAGAHSGLFYGLDDMTISGDDIDGVTLNGTIGGLSAMNGIYHQAGGGTLTRTNGHSRNIISIGGTVHSLVARAQGPYVVQGNIDHDSSMSRHGDDSLGLAFLAYGTGASGVYEDNEVYNCGAHNGAGFYASQGATATVKRNIIRNNTGVNSESGQYTAGGGMYFGGWNNQEFSDNLIYGNTADEGGGVYIHLHGAASAAKAVTANNNTIVDNTTLAGGAEVGGDVMVKSYNATYTLTVNFNNNIIRNSDTYNVYLAGNASTAGITVNFDYNNLQNDQLGVDSNPLITTETITFTNEQTSDLLLTSDYKLGPNSPAKGAGKFISWQDRDVRGRRRSVPPSLGAYEPSSGDPADNRTTTTTRTAATTRAAASTRVAV